jgi:hypothetical protein
MKNAEGPMTNDLLPAANCGMGFAGEFPSL